MLVPALHNNELFINTPIDSLIAWINHRFERLPLEVVEARLALVDAIIGLETIGEDLAEANQQLAFLKAEEKALKPTTVAVDRVVQKTFRDDDHGKEHFENQALLSEAKDEATILECLCKDYAKDKKIAAKKRKEVEKKKEHGALSQEVRQRIEQMLEEVCKIIRSAYHGGDFEGNHCRKFMRNADSAMNAIQSLLLDMPEADRAVGCDDNEILMCCDAFKRLFKHVDGLTHCCHQPFVTLTNNDMDGVRHEKAPSSLFLAARQSIVDIVKSIFDNL